MDCVENIEIMNKINKDILHCSSVSEYNMDRFLQNSSFCQFVLFNKQKTQELTQVHSLNFIAEISEISSIRGR